MNNREDTGLPLALSLALLHTALPRAGARSCSSVRQPACSGACRELCCVADSTGTSARVGWDLCLRPLGQLLQRTGIDNGVKHLLISRELERPIAPGGAKNTADASGRRRLLGKRPT